MNLQEAARQVDEAIGTDNAKMLKRANGAQNVNSQMIQKIQAAEGDHAQKRVLKQLNKALDQVQKFAHELIAIG